MLVKPVLIKHFRIFLASMAILLLSLIGGTVVLYSKTTQLTSTASKTNSQLATLRPTLAATQKELIDLKNVDQVKRNDSLQEEIKNIEKTYKSSLSIYEKIVNLRAGNEKTDDLDKQYALSVKYLSERNFSSAAAQLALLDKAVEIAIQKRAAAGGATSGAGSRPAVASNTPPGAGFSRQSVSTDVGTFTVDLVAADMGSTRVIVDTASDSDCRDNCPVLSLGDYVARNGAFAGINGSYFCPASYPSCAGKTNSFDLLVMNKNKHYFNSDNNVYSTNPVVVFGNGFVRFIGQASGWGRDTGVDGVLSNFPLVLSGGNIAFGGDDDPKKGSKGSRSFVANKGNTIYIGVIHNVTVAEGAHVLKTLGMENAMNLDSGGSTALWSGGYKVGPGRAIPNAILFVRK